MREHRRQCTRSAGQQGGTQNCIKLIVALINSCPNWVWL